MYSIKDEFTGWKLWEILWLLVSVLTVGIGSLFYKDNWMGIAGAVCGIFASVLTGKGKISAYVIGGIGRVFYAFVAWRASFYGEVMLNLFYFVPMEFYGIYVWNKNMNSQTKEVEKRSMSSRQIFILTLIIILSTVAYGFVLKKIGGRLPFVDSFTNVISIIAMIVTIKRYSQTWILWMIVNAVSIVMWTITFRTGTGSLAVLLMWIIYFVNSLVMFVKWTKELRTKN